MAEFPEPVKEEAYRNCESRCQCERVGHGHFGRCPSTFKKRSEARFHHINRFGPDTLSNCEVLCIPCYERSKR
jgi:hypothetical protein